LMAMTCNFPFARRVRGETADTRMGSGQYVD
jgi:hypothetical protein